MSEGLEVLGYINARGGCMLTELAAGLCIPLPSVYGWVDMLCSTGFLKRCDHDHGECPCSRSEARCVSCRCSSHAVYAGSSSRIEVTERGRAIIQRRSDEAGTGEIVIPDGRLPRSGLYPE